MSGKCSICDVTFNSEKQKTDHYEGCKHRKKLRQVAPSSESSGGPLSSESSLQSPKTSGYPRKCPVCPNVELTSESMAKAHTEGEKHRKKLKLPQMSSDGLSKSGISSRDNSDSEDFFDATDGSPPNQPETSGDVLHPNINIDICEVCKCTFNHRDQALAHYEGKDHKKKVKSKKEAEELKAKGQSCYFCKDCYVLCNSLEMLNIHNETPGHLKKTEITPKKLMSALPAKVVQAPQRIHKELVTVLRLKPTKDLVVRNVRDYQRELYKKTLKHNTICFLPTGMGKTLTATLVVSHMIQENPTRQVVFVVDRKILVFQQADAMRGDLREVCLSESDPHSHRPVRIASVCGDKRSLDEGSRKLYEHDLIVITAGSYLNLLESGELRWEDVSCLVLDEAHHCTKRHPYNELMKKYYHDESGTFNHHPKLLGLTASPAGDDTVKKTEVKLRQLMKNMASELAKVTVNEEDFEKHKPTTRIRCEKALYSPEEKHLGLIISTYACDCVAKTNGNAAVETLAEVDIPKIKEKGLDTDIVQRLTQAATVALDKFKPSKETAFLLKHLEKICGSWSVLHDTGVASCLEYLETMKDEFSEAKAYSLPTDRLTSELSTFSDSKEKPAGEVVGSGVQKVIEELLKLPWEERRQQSKRMFALVLVQRREAAAKLQSYLNDHPKLRHLGLHTAKIVGHGKNGQEGSGPGMTTVQQKTEMEHVRNDKYQIIVATSVAEEGLDLPECKLVVKMDVPQTVTSLVQIRGRARERGGEFVAICRKEGQENGIERLQCQEKNMEEATKNIVKQQMMD